MNTLTEITTENETITTNYEDILEINVVVIASAIDKIIKDRPRSCIIFNDTVIRRGAVDLKFIVHHLIYSESS